MTSLSQSPFSMSLELKSFSPIGLCKSAFCVTYGTLSGYMSPGSFQVWFMMERRTRLTYQWTTYGSTTFQRAKRSYSSISELRLKLKHLLNRKEQLRKLQWSMISKRPAALMMTGKSKKLAKSMMIKKLGITKQYQNWLSRSCHMAMRSQLFSLKRTKIRRSRKLLSCYCLHLLLSSVCTDLLGASSNREQKETNQDWEASTLSLKSTPLSREEMSS